MFGQIHTSIFHPFVWKSPDGESRLTGKDLDAGKD